MVVHHVRVQVDILEALHHQEKQPVFLQLGDGVAEVELLDHLAHVLAETVDVGVEVGCQVGRVLDQPLEGEGRGIVEGKTRGVREHGVQVWSLTLVFGVSLSAPCPW